MACRSRCLRIPRASDKPPSVIALRGLKYACAGGGAWGIAAGFARHLGAESHARIEGGKMLSADLGAMPNAQNWQAISHQ
jgi:hypothetical protein